VKLEFKNSLSLKLLRVVLLCALLVGVILSVAQIIFDAHKTRASIAHDAQRILAMFRDPSTQAIYSLDREMGMQVIEGLLQHEAVRHAAIGHPNDPVLAENSREQPRHSLHWLTDPILGSKASFSIPLVGRSPYNEYYGDLHLTLDTAPYGEELLLNSIVIFTTGVLRALVLAMVLYLIYHWMLTKPLSRIIDHLSDINPDHPGEHALPMPRGHERNELGLWVRTANDLLSSIERNSRLRQEAESSLQRMAQYDFLTGLPNRVLLQQQLDNVLDDASRLQRRVAVLCLGLDDFKGINEQFSYETGDQLLIALSDRLRGHSARLSALARLGGDQFALVQSDIDAPYEAAELAQTVLDDIEQPFSVAGHTIQLRATIGITLFPEDGDDTEKLLQKAEQTMTLAKSRSRNRYQFYIASVDSEMRRRRELEKDLRMALERNELFLAYQPQIDYRSHQVVGLEALLRWKHAEEGMIPPDLFIPLAEQNGSIIGIGQWVLDQACRQLRELHDLGFDQLRMAVNLSTVQLHHSELPRVVSNLLQVYRLPQGSLELEVTETGLMEDINTAAKHCSACAMPAH
jgi:diguanylate cyclase (GGDEF)-like protein